MSPFPRPDYESVVRYDPERSPVEVDLSDNTNLWGTHPAALARIRAVDTDDLARYPELYADVLRDAVAERFGIDPASVTTGAGSDDVLDSAFRAAAGVGAVVSYAAPTFSMVEPLARMNGMQPHPISWPDALEDPTRLLADGAAVVYVCRPNNPTGASAPRPWLRALLDAHAGLDQAPLLIVDEAYADFSDDSAIPEAATRPAVLVTRTASKAYGLAGLRCGFAVGAPGTVFEVDKSRGPYKVSSLAAHGVAAAIHDEDGWMAQTVQAARETRVRLTEALRARGVRPLDSDANFLLVPVSGSAREAAALLRERGVGVRPFSGIPGVGEGIRVTVGPWAMMERFLEALDSSGAGAAPAAPGGTP